MSPISESDGADLQRMLEQTESEVEVGDEDGSRQELPPAHVPAGPTAVKTPAAGNLRPPAAPSPPQPPGLAGPPVRSLNAFQRDQLSLDRQLGWEFPRASAKYKMEELQYHLYLGTEAKSSSRASSSAGPQGRRSRSPRRIVPPAPPPPKRKPREPTVVKAGVPSSAPWVLKAAAKARPMFPPRRSFPETRDA